LWYYHNVEFIESRPFTRKLHQLAGGRADEVLRAIQEELARKPDRGVLVPGLGGVRKARMSNPIRGKEKRGGYRYLYLYLEKRDTSTCSCCWIRTSRRMPAKNSAS